MIKYNENSSTFKLWLVYTFRPFKYFLTSSIAAKYKVDLYCPFLKGKLEQLTVVGNIIFLPFIWCVTLIRNIIVFLIFEIVTRLFQILFLTPTTIVLVILRMILIKFHPDRLRKFLTYCDNKDSAWELYYDLSSELNSSAIDLIESNNKLEKFCWDTFGEAFTQHPEYLKMINTPNTIQNCGHRAKILSSISKSLRKNLR